MVCFWRYSRNPLDFEKLTGTASPPWQFQPCSKRFYHGSLACRGGKPLLWFLFKLNTLMDAHPQKRVPPRLFLAHRGPSQR